MSRTFLYSLRFRLLVIVLIAVAPGILVALSVGLEERKLATDNALENARRTAQLMAARGKSSLDADKRDLELFSRLPDLNLDDPDRCLAAINLLSSPSERKRYALYKSNGDLACASPLSERNLASNVGAQPWFRRVARERAFVISDPIQEQGGKGGALILAAPLRTDPMLATGVATVATGIQWLHDAAPLLELPEQATLSCINRNGLFVERTPFEPGKLGRPIPLASEIIPELLQLRRYVVQATGVDAVPRLYAFAPVYEEPGNELFIRIGIPISVAFAAANQLSWGVIALLCAAALLALFGAYLMTELGVIRPAKRLLSATRRLAGGDLSARAGAPYDETEIGELAASLDEMAQALQMKTLQLELAEANYHGIFVNACEGIVRTTPAGCVIEANPAFARMLGYDSPEELKTLVADIPRQLYVQPERRAELLSQLRIHGSITDFELEAYRKDGQKTWLSLNMRCQRDERGEIVYLEGFSTDIQERKRIEDALRKSEEKYRSIFEHAPIGMLQATPEGRFISANATAAALYGYESPEELIAAVSDISSQLFVDPEFRASLIRSIIVSNEIKNVEALIRRKDGSKIWTSRNLRIVRDEQGNIVSFDGFVIDIDQRKQLEAQLTAAKEAAEEANKAKSEFLAHMSHEIRTPMNAILGMTELTLQTGLKNEQRDYLEAVQDSAKHLLMVINDILDISKIEARKLELVVEDFDLFAALTSTMRTLRVQARKKGLYLYLDIAPDVPRYLKGDLARLRQVVINLVGNALKFTEQGGVLATLECCQPPLPQEISLLFTVEDTGVGIPEQLLGRIFERFTQADSSISRKYGGAGLGLAICKELVNMMGGGIWAHSLLEQGSTFGFTACFEPGDPDKAAARFSVKDADRIEPTTSLRVLLVEDNPLNVKLGRAFLQRQGHEIAVALNGQEALQALRGELFDLALMDVEMPVMNGIEATQRIRAGEAGETARNMPIVAMTAHALDDVKQRCLEAGMNDYVSKPFDFQEMNAVIARLSGAQEGGKRFESEILPKPWDQELALRRLDNDQTLYRELCHEFLSQLPERCSAMDEAVASDNFEEARLLAHSLKNMCGAIGLEACRSQAASLEEAARAADSIALRYLWPVFEFERNRAVPLLRAAFDAERPLSLS
jgi:PAS domain S-box-containing protein